MLTIRTVNDKLTFHGDGAKEVHDALQLAAANDARWAHLVLNDGKELTIVLANIVAIEYKK